MRLFFMNLSLNPTHLLGFFNIVHNEGNGICYGSVKGKFVTGYPEGKNFHA